MPTNPQTHIYMPHACAWMPKLFLNFLRLCKGGFIRVPCLNFIIHDLAMEGCSVVGLKFTVVTSNYFFLLKLPCSTLSLNYRFVTLASVPMRYCFQNILLRGFCHTIQCMTLMVGMIHFSVDVNKEHPMQDSDDSAEFWAVYAVMWYLLGSFS